MYEKNIKYLNDKFPLIYNKLEKTEISIGYEQVGETLKVGKLSLFSKYDPVREAQIIFQKWLDENQPVNFSSIMNIVGVSNPYLIKNFILKFKTNLIISNYQLFKILLNYYDFTDIFQKVFLISDCERPNIYDGYKYIIKSDLKLFPEISQVGIESSSFDNPKILIVKPFYGGSLPIINYLEMNLKKNGLNYRSIDSDLSFSTFNLITNTLTNNNSISEMRVMLADFVSKLTYFTIEEFKPDIIIAVAQAPLNQKLLQYAKEKGIVTAFWFVEDYKLFTYWKYFAPLYDYYFVIQKGDFIKELKDIGQKNPFYLPLACEPSIHRPLELSIDDIKKYASGVSFVGAGYYNRRKFFQKFINYDFKIWGSDWDGESALKSYIQEGGRRVSTEESVKIFNASLINLNLHSSTYYEGIDPEGDFVNPRTFEIAACNSYQLVDKRRLMSEHFAADEILSFSTESELKKMINSILNDNQIYKDVRERSYKRVIAEHTYQNRLEQIAQIIGFKVKGVSYPENSKEFYISKYKNLKEIAEAIKSKKDVSRTEVIFLMMRALEETYLK